MATPSSSSGRYVFGPFEFDSPSGDLRKHGSRIRLQGQPLRILALLLERQNQVVSREELQHHLWNNTTFVDFEQGLNAAVNKLRQTLNDSADQPRYIETLPGRGYRFIAPLRSSPARTVLEFAAPFEAEVDSPTPKPSKQWMWLAAAVVCVAVGAYWLGSRTGIEVSLPDASRIVVTPPVGFELEGAASRQSFALSPDGTQLAFTAMDASGAFSVFLRDIGSLESRLLPGSTGAHTLFWPPDGQSLFLTVRGKLRRSMLSGDGFLEVCESPSFCLSGAWVSPDKLLIGGRETYAVSPSGGVPQSLANAYQWPQMLPDGQHVLYTNWGAANGRHHARIGNMDDPTFVKALFESDSRVQYAGSAVTPGAGYLLYIQAGALVAVPFDAKALRITGEATPIVGKVYSFLPSGAADFSVSDRGVIAYQSYVERSQLAWVDRTGALLSTIGPANVNLKSGRLSPDGRMLATSIYDVAKGAQTLWVFDLETGAGRQLTRDAGVRDGPVWSPDSKQLSYLLAATPPPRVAFRSAEGEGGEEALPSNSYRAPTDWSPDGRFLLYTNTGFPRFENETHGDVWMVDLQQGRKILPLLTTPFHEANAVFSPDGRWVAFTSNESGQSELYVQAFEGGESAGVKGKRYPASRTGALAVRWRKDGKELFYLAYDGRVYGVPVTLSLVPNFGQAQSLFTISTEARAAIHSFTGFDVSSDGQRFVIPVIEAGERPSIVVIQNWEALLRKNPGS